MEDNPADSGLVREALTEHRVEGELLVIPDGDRAIRYIQSLETAQENCPDLVIIDLNLPKRSGLEVLVAMTRNAKCREAIKVVLSSSEAQQDRDAALALGADQYIRKPLRLEEFLLLGAVFKGLLEVRR